MVRSMPWKLALIAVGTLASLASQTDRLVAEDAEGVIRICDQAHGQAAHGGTGNAHCQPGQPCGSYGGGGTRYCGTYGHYGNCNGGYHGYGCMKPTGHVHKFLDWFNPHGMCTHSPDHGYAPPGKMRTPHPQQVAYHKNFPDSWTGQPGGAVGGQRPVAIYMPTDTTQLGYYYQAAPRWHANPRMIPSTPIPSQWHRDLCQEQGCPQCRGQGDGNCPHCKGDAHHHGEVQHEGGEIIHEGVIENQPQPVPVDEIQPNPIEQAPVNPENAPAPQTLPENPPVEPPAPVNPAPAAIPLEKAENLNLQPVN